MATQYAFFRVNKYKSSRAVTNLQKHNTRENPPDYLISEDEQKQLPETNFNNKSYIFEEPNKIFLDFQKENARRKASKTERAFSSLAKPFTESLILFNEQNTDEQIKELCLKIAKAKNLRPSYIHIHRDEGKVKNGKLESHNLHCHFGYSVFHNDNPKLVELKLRDYADIKKIISNELELEIADKNNNPHLSHQQFRRLKIEEEKYREKINKEVEQKEKELEDKERLLVEERAKFESQQKLQKQNEMDEILKRMISDYYKSSRKRKKIQELQDRFYLNQPSRSEIKNLNTNFDNEINDWYVFKNDLENPEVKRIYDEGQVRFEDWSKKAKENLKANCSEQIGATVGLNELGSYSKLDSGWIFKRKKLPEVAERLKLVILHFKDKILPALQKQIEAKNQQNQGFSR